MFIDFFEKYNNTAAVGPYVSFENGPHIQSFALSVDRRGFNVLYEIFRCPYPNEDRSHWIKDTEVVSNCFSF